MQQHEMDAVRELIEALVAEIGPDNVPAEIDVDGAIALLTPENANGSQEEAAAVAVEAGQEDQLV
jgi:hypothetical protein